VRRFALWFAVFCLAFRVPAQEKAAGDSGEKGDAGNETEASWDIDSLFDEPPAGAGEAPPEEAPGAGEGSSAGILAGSLRRAGFGLDASCYAYGGITPGWSEAPWFRDEEEAVYSHVVGMILSGGLGLDFQISDTLRIKNTFGYSFPGFAFQVSEFFLDYNLAERVFFRAGKYIHNWGISTNYPFTNLLSRLPPGNPGGNSYVIKADIPIGIGGVEMLALTRDGFIANPSAPAFQEIGFGGKYNLAFRWADIDAGVFYHKTMPLRWLVSVKSTIRNTEIYSEAIASIAHETWDDFRFSANIGFLRDFFGEKVTLNGEVFYNGENNAVWFRPETDLREADVSPFIDGFNGAVNVIYRPRPGGWKDLRFFTQCLYSFEENTAYLVPGLSLAPFPHISAYLAVPMALGSRDGTYYTNNADNQNRPFTVVFLVSVNGSYHFGHYQ
jgi:hypothetical protein